MGADATLDEAGGQVDAPRAPEVTAADDSSTVAQLEEAGPDAAEPRTEAGPAAFQLELVVEPSITYAMAYNRRPVIHRAIVRNLSAREGEPVTLTVGSRWSAADRPPLIEYSVTFDSPPLGGTVEMDLSGCRLDDAAMAEVTESAPAIIEATITEASGGRTTDSKDVDVLARNQWAREPWSLTAAFVQPNHPSVPEITKAAADILKRRTGTSSLEGYQTSPERTDQIAEAIFDALKERIPNYIDPPASFEGQGQKLRPLDQVLDEKQGTCLDLACAYASCLEQAGLHPVIFVVHGHAFTGYFRKEEHRGQTVETNYAAVLSLIDAGELAAVDAVGIPGAGTFEAARRSVRAHFGERSPNCGFCPSLANAGADTNLHPHFTAAIDIYRAHSEGVRPLPARIIRDNVVTLIIDNGPALPPVIERRDATSMKLLPRTVPLRVQQWKNSLLDLTLRPRGLLNFTAEKHGIELVTIVGELGTFEDRLAAGEAIEIVPSDGLGELFEKFDLRLVSEALREQLQTIWRARRVPATLAWKPLEQLAKNLTRRAKNELQDIGVNNLNLGLGLVRQLSDATQGGKAPLSAPVFFIPIKLEYKRGRASLVIRMDEAAITTPNYSLLEWLRAQHGLELEWFRNDMSDDSGLDVVAGLNRIRDELTEKGKSGQFVVEETACIGLFRYEKLRLWKDLEEHWEEFVGNPVVKHLVEGGTTSFHDPADPEGLGAPAFDDTTLKCPQPADGAQTRAIVRALAGHSFVLEGPPGTGKSQTITNLLANSLAEGRKVLFVAEKPEALRVVRDRLRAVGLDPFCLDLHDKGSSTQQIKDQLREALDLVPDADLAAWSDLEADFEVTSGALSRYRDRLHAPTPPAQQSYVEAFEARRRLGDGPTADFGRAAVDVPADRIGTLRDILRGLGGDDARAAQPSTGHPWRFVGSTDLDALDRNAVVAHIDRIARLRPEVTREAGIWTEAAEAAVDHLGLDAVGAAMRLARSGSVPTNSDWRELAQDGRLDRVREALRRMTEALAVLRGLDATAPASILADDLDPVLGAVRTAAASFVIGRRGRLAAALGGLAGLRCFEGKADPVAPMERLAEAARTYRASDAELRSTPALGGRLPAGALAGAELATAEGLASDLVSIARGVTAGTPAAAALLAALDGVAVPTEDTTRGVSDLVETFHALLGSMTVDEAGLRAWTRERTFLAALADSLPAWVDDADGGRLLRLSRWIAFRDRLRPLDAEPFVAFHQQLLDGSVPLEEALDAFDRSLHDATMKVVGETHEFDVFDWMAHDRVVTRFIDQIQDRQQQLRQVIPHGLHGARSFDATASVGMVGQLRTELNSKRRGARSVRDLVNRYPDLILQLTPCFLMSPASVAKFLEPGKVAFDLVVFDEASQIPVADAIGAMGRARSVIIVGDSRQMPPSAGFGRGGSTTDEDDDLAPDRPGVEEVVPEDAESILDECVESGLPSEMLAWHYRSRDEALIAFSNRHYYEGRLASFPGPVRHRPDLGIRYHRVDGQFNHGGRAGERVNHVEADAIVAEVQRRVNDAELAMFSIGVVTLNLDQANLIEKKLGELRDPAVTELLETDDSERSLLIRNLESVQGQERDVIILGTSFSREAGGGAMPLRFGPLNQARGERRLNVAVTRARRQVVVFSSFDPEDLTRANAIGLQHLRDYLERARAASTSQDSVDATAVRADALTAEVAAALRARGLVVHEAYGLSSFKVDLAVTTEDHRGRWLMGVLLDGKEWGSRPLALDRDALPVTVLSGLMEWPAIARVWLPAWMNARDEILESIVARVRVVAQGPDTVAKTSTPTATPSPARSVERHAEPVPAGDGVPTSTARAATQAAAPASTKVRPYVAWTFEGRVGTAEDLERPGSTVTERLIQIATVEGPIQVDDALRAVARTFGLERVRQSRLDALRRHVPSRLEITTPFGTHLFPEDMLVERGVVAADFNWYRRTNYADRPIEAISPHEIANAAAEIARAAHGVAVDELSSELLAHFGYGRRTAEKIAYVAGVVNWAVDAGRLRVASELVHPAE